MAEAFEDGVQLVVGQRAAELSLALLDGRTDAFAQLRGDVVALLGRQERLQLQEVVLD